MELVKWFLEHGADPNEYTRGGIFGVTNFMRVPLFDKHLCNAQVVTHLTLY